MRGVILKHTLKIHEEDILANPQAMYPTPCKDLAEAA